MVTLLTLICTLYSHILYKYILTVVFKCSELVLMYEFINFQPKEVMQILLIGMHPHHPDGNKAAPRYSLESFYIRQAATLIEHLENKYTNASYPSPEHRFRQQHATNKEAHCPKGPDTMCCPTHTQSHESDAMSAIVAGTAEELFGVILPALTQSKSSSRDSDSRRSESHSSNYEAHNTCRGPSNTTHAGQESGSTNRYIRAEDDTQDHRPEDDYLNYLAIAELNRHKDQLINEPSDEMKDFANFLNLVVGIILFLVNVGFALYTAAVLADIMP